MEVNRANVTGLYTGFNTAFNMAFTGVKPVWNKLAMDVPSTTSQEVYGWLGQMPGFREWIGERVIKNLKQHDYTIKNKKFESSIAVNRDHIEDDTYGVFTPMVSEMGRLSAVHPDELIFGLLKTGFAKTCYDGQYFFDTDHPVVLADGTQGSWSNYGGGAGTPWYLLDTSRAVKPLIRQKRRDYSFRSMTDLNDQRVFMTDEFVFGVDGRSNAGFGLPQLAYGSKQALDVDTYAAARAAMGELKGDEGRPLGITPNLLVVPPSHEKAGLEVLKAQRNAAGADNVYAGTAELLVVPWLA
ncbi:MAG: hypothetical protein GC184_14660 [Rhizobiales bacterium]|nr:hypothetical protein [Hyphomicrobiales bacterium]